MTPTIHIAGQPKNGVQRCIHCGLVLEDRTKEPPASGIKNCFWEPAEPMTVIHEGRSCVGAEPGAVPCMGTLEARVVAIEQWIGVQNLRPTLGGYSNQERADLNRHMMEALIVQIDQANAPAPQTPP